MPVALSPEYTADPLAYLLRRREEDGDVFALTDSVTIVAEPGIIRRLLAETDRNNVPSATPKGSGGPGNRPPDRIARWPATRRRALRVLGPRPLQGRGQLIADAAETELAARVGHHRELVPVLQEVGGMIAARLLAGPDYRVVGAWGVRTSRVNARAFTGRTTLSRVNPVSWPGWLAGYRARHAAAGILRDRRRTGPGGHDDVLDQFVTDPDAALDDRLVSGFIKLTAGAATVPAGIALSWTLFELARNEQVREQAAAEVSRLPAAELLRDPHAVAPTLYGAVREALRLHPPVWLIQRTATDRVELGELTVQPGDTIAISPYLVHRSPRWWPDPEVFDPGRWAGAPHADAFVPFGGGGGRSCLGAWLTEHILCVATALMLTKFRLEIDDLDQVRQHPAGVLVPKPFGGRIVAADSTTPVGG